MNVHWKLKNEIAPDGQARYVLHGRRKVELCWDRGWSPKRNHKTKDIIKMTKLLSEDEVTGKAKEIFQDIKATFGMVPNFFKAQAAVDTDWLELNWTRVKKIMLAPGALDRKTKEIIAMTVSLINHCEYCALAHETMAMMVGAAEKEIIEAKQVMELFCSFNAIADTLRVPCDILPDRV